MASVVDIVNLAATHFGQAANVSSIDPPEGSVLAEQAAIFYPIARDECLEMHNWTFARARKTLTQFDDNARVDFQYRYALPADCIKPRALASDDGWVLLNEDQYEIEGPSVYTHGPGSTLVYTFRLQDTTKFSPMFVIGLSLRLASYLSGPVLKDATGRVQAALYERSRAKLVEAAVSDANSDSSRPEYHPKGRPWRSSARC